MTMYGHKNNGWSIITTRTSGNGMRMKAGKESTLRKRPVNRSLRRRSVRRRSLNGSMLRIQNQNHGIRRNQLRQSRQNNDLLQSQRKPSRKMGLVYHGLRCHPLRR